MNKREKLIKDAGAEIGDIVELSKDDATYRGRLMPHHEFSAEDIITIKRKDGYNIGVAVTEKSTIKVIQKKENHVMKHETGSASPNKPTVSIIGTGGTIASYVDYRTGAVHPAKSSDEIVASVPELKKICNVKGSVLFSIMSEDMQPTYWQKIAREVKKELDNGASGVVITHGTDTMGYTAAALSFMLRNLTGPVVLTGSQRSSDRPSSDANINLLSSARVAISDIGEVVVVMHGETSDNYGLIQRGTKVRKMHTSRRDAFQSINTLPIGKIEGEKITLLQKYRKKGGGTTEIHDALNENVCLIYTYPGMDVKLFESIIKKYDGVVIAGTGLGHTPTKFIESIKNAVKDGKTIVMTSQCLFGRVNMNVYSTGRDLLKAGVLLGEDMLPETAYVKLMWVLGQTKERSEIIRLIGKNIAGEISERTTVDAFYHPKV
jgi:glutamyl-tRNA(Gln) amidotransferase subunit D